MTQTILGNPSETLLGINNMNQQNLENGVILIVDDNPTNLSVLSQALRGAGLSVRIAVDGESAIEQITHKQPDLILLDVQMPGIGGFETCRRLKADPLTHHIPIIFATALNDIENKSKGFSLGAVDYISKPFEQGEVIARVRIHLQLKQLTETLEQRVAERTAALEQTQIQLVQQEKLSALGQLMAGVAHEMNNPIGCIINNLVPAQEYVGDLAKAIKLYQDHCQDLPTAVQDEIDAIELDYVLKDLPDLLASMKHSSERIKDISIALRNFARADTAVKQGANLHSGLDSTLLILGHRLKAVGDRPAIEVIKDYGNVPEIECHMGQMNQVFMNLLANAIDAIEESARQNQHSGDKPTITIRTEFVEANSQPSLSSSALGAHVLIRIADNGIGMTDSVKQQVFKHMFTTKPVGQGTGLGLAIVHQIVVEKHGGMIAIESAPGKGSEFVIALPVKA